MLLWLNLHSAYCGIYYSNLLANCCQQVSVNFTVIFLQCVRTIIIKDDLQLAYSLDWRYGSVLGKNSLRIHQA